jgi:hypothetical protein
MWYSGRALAFQVSDTGSNPVILSFALIAQSAVPLLCKQWVWVRIPVGALCVEEVMGDTKTL